MSRVFYNKQQKVHFVFIYSCGKVLKSQGKLLFTTLVLLRAGVNQNGLIEQTRKNSGLLGYFNISL